MELQVTTCEKVESRGSCKCDKCRVHKVDKWLLKKQTSRCPMCYQFRKAYIDKNQHTLEHLEGIFGYGRCLCCGYTFLQLAVNVASKDLTEHYLSRNHNVELRNDNGETALHLACAINDCWFVEQLLNAKADVNVVDDLGCTPLQICLGHDTPSAAILKLLLAHNARPNKLFSLDEDIEKSIAKMINANTRNSSGVLPLYEAIHKGDHITAQQLLKDGACPNSLNCYRRSLLQVACYNKAVECAEALINAGANVNESDVEGRTALHYAVISESTEIVKLLLASHCDLWLRDSDGYTALGMAVLTNRLQVTDQLLDHGASCTELLLVEALERQCSEVALSILRRCYFRLHDTKLGRTLLYCAIATGQQQIVSYLQSVGVEVGFEGSDDEELNVPLVRGSATTIRKTRVSARFVSRNLVAYGLMESSSRRVNSARYSLSVPKTKASSVPSKSVATRSTDNSIGKAGSYNATKSTRMRAYVAGAQHMASSAAHPSKQSRYARHDAHWLQTKLHNGQQDKVVRAKTCDTLEMKNRCANEQQPSRKFLGSNDRFEILADKRVSSKGRKTTIHSNSFKISSAKTDPTVNSNVKLIVKSASKKSLTPPMTKNVDSFFHIYCEKQKNSKLTRYEGVCFKSFSKHHKVNSVLSNVDKFFKFHKYCVQY